MFFGSTTVMAYSNLAPPPRPPGPCQPKLWILEGHAEETRNLTLTAVRRTTLSDPRWDIQGATAQRMKRLRDENPPKTHKKRRTETLEVPSDLQDMEIPLEDMGDVIVLTGL